MLHDKPGSFSRFPAHKADPWPAFSTDDLLYACIISFMDFSDFRMVFYRTQLAAIDQLLRYLLIFMLHQEQLLTELFIQGWFHFLRLSWR